MHNIITAYCIYIYLTYKEHNYVHIIQLENLHTMQYCQSVVYSTYNNFPVTLYGHAMATV